MPDRSSAYYPPRARWYGRFRSAGQAFLRRLPLDRVRLPGGFSLRQFLVALALPGYVFFVLGRVRVGQVVLGLYALLVFVALFGFGSSAAAFAFGLMVALHGLSWASLIQAWWQPTGWKQRILLALFATLLVAMLWYLPLQRFIQNYWVTPFRLGDQTILVIPTRESALRPGMTAVFHVVPESWSGLQIGRGFVVAEILGQPGDRIQFDSGRYRVNESVRPALAQMPVAGEWVVPENHWFIWPFSSMGIQGNLAAANSVMAESALRRLALVPMSNAVGRPLRWWFWRDLYVP